MKAVKAALLAVQVLLLAGGGFLTLAYLPEGRMRTLFFICLLSAGLLNAGYYLYFRKRFINFTGEICRNAERIMRGEKEPALQNRETLTSKAVMELERMEDIIRNRLSESEKERDKLQKTVSELSHQLKTPLTNVHMYLDMLTEPDVDRAQARQFMEIIQSQLGKLEFLIETLRKTSQLECDMIRLNLENNRIIHTLELALSGILRGAEQKSIELAVNCRPSIRAPHDSKWTAEAVGNILDNAVKYTPEGGKISIDVIPGEMYVEIKIQDTGKGISPEHYNDIFKRFYRESSVSEQEGLGLGLYIARNIISLQGGHILVRSVMGRGSCFSVFLPDWRP